MALNLEKLAIEIRRIASTDPSRRLRAGDWPGAEILVHAVNQLADRRQNRAMAGDLPFSTGDTGCGRQPDLLAAFIAEMPEGVLICNPEGRIILFNRRAREHLALDGAQPESEAPPSIPLGHSVTAVLDRQLIEHALEEIKLRLNHRVVHANARFVFENHRRHAIRAQVTPVPDCGGRMAGFIITLNDITRRRETDRRVDALLRRMTKSARSPLASIRAAGEAMLEYPDMDADHQRQFKEIVHKESLALSQILNQVSDDYAGLRHTQWSRTPLTGTDLIEAVKLRARNRLGIVMHTDCEIPRIWLKADMDTLLLAVLHLLHRLQEETGRWEFQCRLGHDGNFAALDLDWTGPPLEAETLGQWENQYLMAGGEKSPLTLKEVIDHHEAALWPRENPSGLRLLLPATPEPGSGRFRPIATLPDSPGRYYDPDLLAGGDRDPALDTHLLTELNYTVLIREVSEAVDIEAMARKYRRLSELIADMMAGGSKVRHLTRLITAFADAVLQRTIGLAMAEAGPPPAPFAFMVLGSEGRREQTLKTDQDNAIVYQDVAADHGTTPETVRAYFLGLGEAICTALDRIGYDFCTGGVMARNAQWCQPLSTWKKYFSGWIRTVEPKDLLHASIFFDFNFAFGEHRLVEALRRHMFASLAGRHGFFRHLAGNALTARPPIGFFGNFVVKSKGEHRNQLDIKLALLPIVDFARIYALKNGIQETNTQERLYQLYRKKIITREEYNEIDQAYDFMMQIRFAGQIKAIREDDTPPHNHIDPKNLSTIEQKMLKEIFKRVEKVQAKIDLDYPGAQETH